MDNKLDLAKSYYRPVKGELSPSAAEIATYPGWKQPNGFSLSCSQPNAVYAYAVYHR